MKRPSPHPGIVEGPDMTRLSGFAVLGFGRMSGTSRGGAGVIAMSSSSLVSLGGCLANDSASSTGTASEDELVVAGCAAEFRDGPGALSCRRASVEESAVASGPLVNAVVGSAVERSPP